MIKTKNYKTKERIINASMKLFSKKGFDATGVNEIANEAKVAKALIYYYFKSKEDILDYLVNSLLDDTTSIAMDFIHSNIVKMIKDGQLDIEKDRLHFSNKKAMELFLRNAHTYYETVLNHVLKHRSVLRILMLESLKSSKYHKDLFKFMDLIKSSDDNPIFKTISEADKDFNYSDDMVFFKFFFSTIPLINFAAYYDDYKKITTLSDKELRGSFIRSFQIISNSLISGSDILMRNKNIKD